MRIIDFIVLFMLTPVLGFQVANASENPRFYLGKNHHYIDWANVETKSFLDYDIFVSELKKMEKNPDYDMLYRNLNNYEKAGLVLSCVGDCELLKGNMKNQLRYLSSVREGDEILTNENSYMWIFLLDGTMVRLSPQTSLTINEINLGRKKNFLFVRLNYGNALWLGRGKQLLNVNDRRETDRLFLSLKLRRANRLGKSVNRHFDEINDLVKKNNILANKKTETFLVMANGSVHGMSLVGEFTSLFNGKSYVKLRDYEQLGLMNKGELNENIVFHYRGHTNTKTKKLNEGRWYEIDQKGESIRETSNGKFELGEIITKNIPTVILARELMLEEYSLPLFSSMSKKAMGEKFGYRIWKSDELNERLSFIENYTRRLETTQLMVLKQFWEEKKDFVKEEFDSKYYLKAMNAYATQKMKTRQSKSKKVLLNSEKKKFWKVINGQ